MTPFKRIERDATMSMELRLALLQQPAEFFRQFFGEQTPSLEEIAIYVECAVQRMISLNIYENDIYHVEVNYAASFVHLDIRRHDRESCKNWRELQQIKNELVGAEHEAVELFPAESRLVDTANQYHLWVHVNADYRFPFGFPSRCVFREPISYQRYEFRPDEMPGIPGLPMDQVA